MKKIYLLLILLVCSGTALADTEMLINEIKKLTGEVEMLKYDIRILKQQIEKIQAQNAVPKISDAPIVKSELKKESKEEVLEATEEEPKQEIKEEEVSQFSEKAQYDLALSALKDKKYDLAKIKFDELIRNYPESSLLDRMIFWYAEALFYQKDFYNSASFYLKCYQKYPKGQKAPDALLKVAMSLGELKQPEQACQILDKLEKEFLNLSSSMKKSMKDLKLKHNCK